MWSKVEHKVVLPTDDEQRRLHSLIYQHINKTNSTHDAVYAFLDELSEHHQTDSFIAGCTEVTPRARGKLRAAPHSGGGNRD